MSIVRETYKVRINNKIKLISGRFLIVLSLCTGFISGCANNIPKQQNAGSFSDKSIETIALGSCLNPHNDQTIWQSVEATNPDLFLFLGDNVYADRLDGKWLPVATEESFKKSYHALLNNVHYQRLSKRIPVFPIWDDHDYGQNDGGAENPVAAMAKDFFLSSFNLPQASEIRKRQGVYYSKIKGEEGKRVQLIFLDTRSFRTDLTKAEPGNKEGYQRYQPSSDPQQNMLGEVQWKWLEEELNKPADLRIIASSIQVLAEDHGWERWGNFPKERQRFFDLLTQTNAKGVVLVSGDRHQSGLYFKAGKTPYPLYELTASSLNMPIPNVDKEMDSTQVGYLVSEASFGLIHLDWENRALTLEIQNKANKTQRSIMVPFSEIQ